MHFTNCVTLAALNLLL